MKLLLIIAVAGFLYGWITYKPPKKKKAPADPPPVVTMEYCRQQEQERKQAARKAQAQRDIEHYETMRDYYISVQSDAAREIQRILKARKEVDALEEKYNSGDFNNGDIEKYMEARKALAQKHRGIDTSDDALKKLRRESASALEKVHTTENKIEKAKYILKYGG